MQERLISYIIETYGKYGNAWEWLYAARKLFPGLNAPQFSEALQEAGRRAKEHARELESFETNSNRPVR